MTGNKTKLVMILCALLMSSYVKAQNIYTGTELIRWCNEEIKVMNGEPNTDETLALACVSYISRYTDAFSGMGQKNHRLSFCLPEEGGSYGQYVRVVHRYLQEHPEKLHMHRLILVPEALHAAFPCPG